MIIDFHSHIFPSYFRDERHLHFGDEPSFEVLYRSPEARLAGKKALIETMEEEGVDKSVVFGFPWKRTDHFKRHNDYIIESVQQYPDRLIGFCCFDPLSPDAVKEAERCLSEGLSGIGELALYERGFSVETIKAFRELMEVAHSRHVPLLIHTNEPVGHKYPGKAPMTLNQIYNFIKAFPRNDIVLAHWGGGIFFYGLMKKEVQDSMGNVYFDTAASPYLYRPEVYQIAGKIIGFDKILFGSDYPLLKPGRYFKEMSAAVLSTPHVNGIRGKNAARLLHLNPTA